MKLSFTILLIYSTLVLVAQRPSEYVIEKDKYGANTNWSCVDKHFGYYSINYSMPIPIINSVENPWNSRSLKFAYTYRYRLLPKFDLGVELSYVNRVSSIVSDSCNVFDPSTLYSTIKTYQNGFGTNLYFRFTLSDNDYRNLGWHIDLGGYYEYYLWRGLEYKLKNKDVYQKLRFKQSDFLSLYDYGAFVRFGKNNISFIASYSFGDWIQGFSAQNLSFERPALLIGIQLNLYAK